MKRYPVYKDSGVPWLGQVPEHWEVKRCKHYLRERNLRSVDGAETLLSVSEYFGVKPRAEAIDDGDVLVRAKTLVDYKVCRVGDLVMNIMLAWKRAYGVTRHEGIVSPAYAVFRFTSDQLLPEYLHYLLRTDMYADEFKRNSTGVIDSRLRLYPEEFFRIPFLVPPVKEQEDVIRFLVEAVGQMDSAISSQERMIELLKERRSAIITQAVTKGLDPKAKMKDSGIPWLGQVPANWEVKKLTHTAVESGTKNAGMVEENLLSLSYGQIIRKDIDSNEGLLPASFEGYQIVEKGDTVLRLTDLQNDQKSLRAGFVSERGIITSAYCAVRPTAVSGRWLFNALRAADLLKVFYSMGGGVRQSLDFESIKRIEIPIPSREEQLAIDAYLIAEESRIRSAISSQERMIELLKERRSAVISQAVTGQIDVR